MLALQNQKIARISKEIAKLQEAKSHEAKKVADLQKKCNSARQAINRTKHPHTITNKLNEISRCEKQIADCQKRIADIERKISTKQNEHSKAEVDRSRERERESRRSQMNAQEQNDAINHLTNQVAKHSHTLSELEKLPSLPDEITVLFFAANPIDKSNLRLDEEVRAIEEEIRKSKHRDSVNLVSKWAVRTSDVLLALNEHKPHIVHFSGHGSKNDEIVFQNDRGEAKFISKEAIVQTMMTADGNLRLVFFNTCYSRNQAEAIVHHVEAAIGMKTVIGDEAARIFAAQFYSSLGFGLSVQKAFEQAKSSLMLENIHEEDTPELFVSNGLDPEQIILVTPASE